MKSAAFVHSLRILRGGSGCEAETATSALSQSTTYLQVTEPVTWEEKWSYAIELR